MPIYFMLHDAGRFQQLQPALAASWRQRSFEPCRVLCAELAPAVRAFIERYHLGREEPLLFQVDRGLPFQRDYWRLLVGEVLLLGAAEVPEIQTAPDTLGHLLAPEQHRDSKPARERWAPIEQAHYGARDLVFGGFYRPEAAGYNDSADVARLASYLASCDPGQWTMADLQGGSDGEDDERAEELEFARQSLLALQQMYAGALTRGQMVVCEVL